MNIFQQFFKPSYIFNAHPSFVQNEVWFYLVFFLVILVGAILAKKFYDRKSLPTKPYNFFSQRYFGSFLTCAIIGFVLLFFRWQYIYYLSSRILIIIDFLITVVFLIIFLHYIIRKLPQELEKFARQEHFQKYIPQPKKKL